MSESEMGMRLRDTGNTALLEGSHDTRPMLISDHEDELLRVEHGYPLYLLGRNRSVFAKSESSDIKYSIFRSTHFDERRVGH